MGKVNYFITFTNIRAAYYTFFASYLRTMDIRSAEPYTEIELINGCVRRDPKAQKYLYEKYSSKMLAVCYRYTGNRDEAQDLLHDGFISLFDKIKSYSGTGSFEGWMRKYFVNVSLMHLRKRDILKFPEDFSTVDREISDNPSVLDNIAVKDLLKLIASMPTGFRTVFNLYVIEGFSHQEIGKMLNITESSFRSQLSRAREWLKDSLSGLSNK